MNGSLYDVLHVLFKRKRIIALAFLFIFLPVAYVALTKPTVYRASARLTVTEARAYPLETGLAYGTIVDALGPFLQEDLVVRGLGALCERRRLQPDDIELRPSRRVIA